MKPFLDELQATLECGIWSPVVLGLLILPDACGAVEYPVERNGKRYKLWYDTYVGAYPNPRFRFDGEVLWKLRNGMMHETSLSLAAYGYDRVLFTVPNRQNHIMHMCLSTNNGGVQETTLTVYLPQFLEDVKRGVETWLDDVERDQNPERKDRMDRLIQFRPNGLPPHIVGLGLVA
jgi:hypothetical protein